MISIGSIPEKKIKNKIKNGGPDIGGKNWSYNKKKKKGFRNDFTGTGNVLTLFLVKTDFIIFTVQAKSAGFKPCVFLFLFKWSASKNPYKRQKTIF